MILVLGLILVFGLSLYRDTPAVAATIQPQSSHPVWIQTLRDEQLEPTDLILAEAAEIVRFYLGRAEFYVDDQDDYERYAYRAPDGIRHAYAASLLIRTRSDFDRLVRRPNDGRVLWLIGRGDRLLGLAHRMEAVDRSLWQSLIRSADRVIHTSDGWLLVRVTLPRRDG